MTTCYSLRSQAEIKHVVIFLKYYSSCWIWSQWSSWSVHANMAYRRCIGLLTIHTVVYLETTCSPARAHAQYTFLLSNTQPLSRCGIILMPDGNICRPKQAEVELVQTSSVGNAAAGQAEHSHTYRPPPLQRYVLPQQKMELVQESHFPFHFYFTVS